MEYEDLFASVFVESFDYDFVNPNSFKLCTETFNLDKYALYQRIICYKYYPSLVLKHSELEKKFSLSDMYKYGVNDVQKQVNKSLRTLIADILIGKYKPSDEEVLPLVDCCTLEKLLQLNITNAHTISKILDSICERLVGDDENSDDENDDEVNESYENVICSMIESMCADDLSNDICSKICKIYCKMNEMNEANENTANMQTYMNELNNIDLNEFAYYWSDKTIITLCRCSFKLFPLCTKGHPSTRSHTVYTVFNDAILYRDIDVNNFNEYWEKYSEYMSNESANDLGITWINIYKTEPPLGIYPSPHMIGFNKFYDLLPKLYTHDTWKMITKNINVPLEMTYEMYWNYYKKNKVKLSPNESSCYALMFNKSDIKFIFTSNKFIINDNILTHLFNIPVEFNELSKFLVFDLVKSDICEMCELSENEMKQIKSNEPDLRMNKDECVKNGIPYPNNELTAEMMIDSYDMNKIIALSMKKKNDDERDERDEKEMSVRDIIDYFKSSIEIAFSIELE